MRLILITSLVANVLLILAVVSRHSRHLNQQFPRPFRVQMNSAEMITPPLKPQRVKSHPATAWQSMENINPTQFVANLRAIGCPEQTIRDIVVTRISREFQSRVQAEYEEAAKQQEWWRGRTRSLESSQLGRLRPALMRERDDAIEELFGEPANRLILETLAWSGTATAGRELLPAEKRTSLREIEERYVRLNEEATFPVGEPLDDEDRTALAVLQRQKRAEMEALLTPQELEQLDLRESAAAKYVLANMPAAETESDFRAMFLAARENNAGEDIETTGSAMARRYGLGPDRASDPSQESRVSKQKAIETRAKELIGEPRFNQLQQAEIAREPRPNSRTP